MGNRRWVRERTISKNSWLVGTTGISFHCVFMFAVVMCRAKSVVEEGGMAKKLSARPINTKIPF